MLIVVGSRHDQGANAIVQQWERWDAALLSCEDLSTPGWRYNSEDRESSRAVVSGRIVREQAIRGVLVRRPCVLPQELMHLAAPDREFVAAEMTAFLVAWLNRLPCRVLNRPRGSALCGPGWRPQQWVMAAANAGLQPAVTRWDIPQRTKTDPSREPYPQREFVVVGRRCFGHAGKSEAANVRRLAAAAGVSLLGVWLSGVEGGTEFVAATPMPSLSDPAIADTVAKYLLSTAA